MLQLNILFRKASQSFCLTIDYLKSLALSKSFIIAGALALILAQSCSHTPKCIGKSRTLSIAWKDDSSVSYQLVLCTENKFGYAIVERTAAGERKKFYCGTYKHNWDTVFLTYNKNRRPPHITEYLIWATPRTYLIQFFQDKPEEMFLNARHYFGMHVR